MGPTTGATATDTPEIGAVAVVGEARVNYHDLGQGRPVLLIHGSGPGVSAWANWRAVFPRLTPHRRVIAPDMVGFGYTEFPVVRFDIDLWIGQLTGLLENLEVDRVSVIGNSFGGALAVHLAERRPELVDRLVLMGPVATSFPLTEGLDKVWGYEPSLPAMDELVRQVFVHVPSWIGDDLVELRYRASARPTVQERYAALFPEPRQRWLDALGLPPERLARISVPTLIVHGADDRVIPVAASRTAAAAMPHARLEVVDACGHWVQIEHTATFCDLVTEFLSEDDGGRR